MTENTRKGIGRKYKIMEYVLSMKNFRYTDFIKDLKDFGSESTLNRELQELVGMKWIEQNTKTKEYRINPFIKTLDIDITQQLKTGREEIEKLLRKQEKQERKIEANIKSSFEKEILLRNRIMTQTHVSFYFNEEKVNEKLVFSKDTDQLIKDLVYSLIRNGIIMPPENWKSSLEPFNLGIVIEANLKKEQQIFNLISELRNEYKTIKKRIPHSIVAPFNISKVIEIPEEHKDDFEDFAHKEAFYREKYEKKIVSQQLNNFKNNFSQMKKIFLKSDINEEIKNSEFKGLLDIFEKTDFSEIKSNPSKILDYFNSLPFKKLNQLFDKEISEENVQHRGS